MQVMEALPLYYQAATLVALPSHPNSLAWSNENLLAIPSENLITILNPASLTGARGFITLRQNKPFPIGLVERKDLLNPCLRPICLSRDTRPHVRSISWSPPGLAPNSGCFLAVCTTDGHVKLFRAPYCEYSSEWIEVVDISDLLFDHITSREYREQHDPPLGICEVKASEICSKQSRLNDRFILSVCRKSSRGRKRKGPSSSFEGWHAHSAGEAASHGSNANISSLDTYYSINGVTLQDNEAKLKNENRHIINQVSRRRHITAEHFASQSALLSSLVVAWSPILQSLTTCFAILCVGSKFGAISFWSIYEPKYFTIKHRDVPVNAKLIGLIKAHNSWITAICFGFSAANFSESQLVLATGSSDGSVKIWSGNIEDLSSAEVGNDCFSLLAEVKTATFCPVSTISLIIPAKSPERVVLAIGSGAGKVEVWIFDISSMKLQSAGEYDGHEQVVTGLSWAFDGRCLYSCSQDNSIRSWIFYGNSLYEAPLFSKFCASNASSNISKVSDLCFGLALSPGNLMLALVRSLDASLQNPMYEMRSQRAVVDFFWIGGQSLEVPNKKSLDNCRFEERMSSSTSDLAIWETNILRNLMYSEDVNKPVVIWDTIVLLKNLRKEFPCMVENILTKWISSWFPDPSSVSPENILALFRDRDNLLRVSSRELQVLNIVCRRLMLSEMDFNLYSDDLLRSDKLIDKESKPNFWNELLTKSEGELRERLVAFLFHAVLNHTANIELDHEDRANWLPVGVAQMQQWTAINHQMIYSRLKALGSEVAKLRRRNDNGISEYVEKENCGFCSALVPFESPVVARCQGIVNQKGSIERHKLTRCMASMRLCSVIEPLWFCMCCRRQAATLPPRSFFTMRHSPLDFRSESAAVATRERSAPLCPYCGVLLQRSMPDFLLSTSPV